MALLHIMTVNPALPAPLLDRVLTHTEQALHAHGAARVWIAADQPPLTVMAEVPLRVLPDPVPGPPDD